MTDNQVRLIAAMMLLSAGVVTVGLGSIARATNTAMGLGADAVGLLAVIAGIMLFILSNARLREKSEKEGEPEEPSQPNE